MSQSDDSALLVARLAGGDAQALELLLERHLPQLRVFVRARLGSELRALESSSDIVQSTCRELLEHRERFQFPGPDGFRQWLFTTAVRKISERVRRGRALKRGGNTGAGRQRVPAIEESRLLAAYSRFSSPSHGLAVAEELKRVERALERLDPEQREVVLLAHVAELPRAEIARRLRKSEVAVRSILHRALARIAVELDATR